MTLAQISYKAVGILSGILVQSLLLASFLTGSMALIVSATALVCGINLLLHFLDVAMKYYSLLNAPEALNVKKQAFKTEEKTFLAALKMAKEHFFAEAAPIPIVLSCIRTFCETTFAYFTFFLGGIIGVPITAYAIDLLGAHTVSIVLNSFLSKLLLVSSFNVLCREASIYLAATRVEKMDQPMLLSAQESKAEEKTLASQGSISPHKRNEGNEVESDTNPVIDASNVDGNKERAWNTITPESYQMLRYFLSPSIAGNALKGEMLDVDLDKDFVRREPITPASLIADKNAASLLPAGGTNRAV